ncbi:MAG: hypothetical protein V2I26_17550, partial [Halieaceae bacterium]|nr:hypothetical protein [Halieaceae bacterium]
SVRGAGQRFQLFWGLDPSSFRSMVTFMNTIVEFLYIISQNVIMEWFFCKLKKRPGMGTATGSEQ